MAVRLDRLQEQREAATFTVSQLARASLTSDFIIIALEQSPTGGTCREEDAQRIADALALTLSELGVAELDV